MVKKLLIAVVVIVVAFIGVGMILPSEFHVERSVTIDAPAEKVFPHVVDLKQWKNWGVWFKRDPDMVVNYSGPDSAVGMRSEWVSETEGSGEMEIIEVKENESIKYTLYFPEFEMGSTGELNLIEQDGQTKVVWADYGDVGSNPINHYFAAMMDGMIGPDFEAGLDNLKMMVENGG